MSQNEVAAAAAAFAAGEVTYREDEPAELPPTPTAEPMVPLAFRVPVAVEKRVKAAAEQDGVSYSQLCRQWIEQGLTERDENVTVPLSLLNRLIAQAAQHGQAA